MRRTILSALLVVAFCLAVIVTRAIWQGRSALASGDQAAKAGDTTEAIRWWRRAARWYVPLAPHVGDAYDRLEELARSAEAKGDQKTALAAWEGVRGSILATRSFFTPESDRLDPANQHIAALMAHVEGPAADPSRSEAERRTWHHDLLARDEAPSVPWTLVALLGFALWIGGGVYFVRRGMSAEDRLVPRAASTSAVLIAVGLVVWLLGLHNA